MQKDGEDRIKQRLCDFQYRVRFSRDNGERNKGNVSNLPHSLNDRVLVCM